MSASEQHNTTACSEHVGRSSAARAKVDLSQNRWGSAGKNASRPNQPNTFRLKTAR